MHHFSGPWSHHAEKKNVRVHGITVCKGLSYVAIPIRSLIVCSHSIKNYKIFREPSNLLSIYKNIWFEIEEWGQRSSQVPGPGVWWNVNAMIPQVSSYSVHIFLPCPKRCRAIKIMLFFGFYEFSIRGTLFGHCHCYIRVMENSLLQF